MAEARRGLGRGLSALLDEVDAPLEGHPPAGLVELPVDQIKANPHQPRRRFDEAELESLGHSIREKGMLQPILVRPSVFANEYQIVAGERRWRAAVRTGARVIPALVRSLSDAETLELAIIENVQRADLSPIEEAEGYKALIDQHGRTQAQVAEIVGKSRVHVTNLLRLLQLPESVRDMLREGQLSAGQARPLIGSPDAERLAEEVAGRGLTARQAERLARGRQDAAPRAGKDADTALLEHELAESLGMSVQIRDAGGAGELRVRYTTLEQLDDLCRRLSRS